MLPASSKESSLFYSLTAIKLMISLTKILGSKSIIHYFGFIFT
ncbi:hypothetical protein NIES4071_29120 [Calothrix sp. NIES-4071]|nr:hypothetical protein NIES4071_29120 [Calothrix sp. NIES-4071]BAZ57233.1 hypothetical protein NIES4105_29060 [Calothrix sp. NIES-4105]